jgi:mycothiol synthase
VAIAVTSLAPLGASQQAVVRELAARIAAEDGAPPLSDQALARLGSDDVEHLAACADDRLVGYAQLDGRSLEIAAAVQALGSLLDIVQGRPILVWSHGRRSRLAAPLAERGFARARVLHQLRRSLHQPVPEPPPPPPGVEIRPFRLGRDEHAWLRVNAAAFAQHPEQASWTVADLRARESETWFDPAGFLLAWRDGDLLGFHWTKVHPDGAGEVYVIGVAPSAQGSGLGAVLLERGLAHLRRRGCPEVLLYVDEGNAGALRLYERSGFTRFDHDVQWRSPTGHGVGGSNPEPEGP